MIIYEANMFVLPRRNAQRMHNKEYQRRGAEQGTLSDNFTNVLQYCPCICLSLSPTIVLYYLSMQSKNVTY